MLFDTPDRVGYFRLASLKGMLKLEKAGLKTRGGAIRPRIAGELGLKARDPHDKFIAEIERRMGELFAAQQDEMLEGKTADI